MSEHSFKLLEPQLLVDLPSLDSFNQFPAYVQPKMDGFRLLAFVETVSGQAESKVTLMSRSMKPFDNFAELEDHFKHFPPDYVYDCEVVGYVGADRAKPSFKALTVRARALRGKNTHIKVKAFIFDVISIKDWDKENLGDYEASTTPHNHVECRLHVLRRHYSTATECAHLFNKTLAEHIELVPTEIVHSGDFLRKRVAFWMDTISDEGVVIKLPNSRYRHGRAGSDWFKYKKSMTVDLFIIGFNEGSTQFNPISGKKDGGVYRSGKVGSLICEGEHEGKIIKAEPKGFTDALARDMFQNFHKYKGQCIEVEGQELTRAIGASHYAVKHPNFVRFRPDKTSNGRKFEPEPQI